jgi:hypothetical protein
MEMIDEVDEPKRKSSESDIEDEDDQSEKE